MGLNQEQAKQELRRQLLFARSRLTAAEVADRSAAIAAQVLALPAFQAALHVVVYTAIATEVDPARIAGAAADLGKHVYYPVSSRDRFEFASAKNGSAPTLSADAPRVCFLVPGVGFDGRGVRLGRGSGWYDRALARYPTAVRVGLAYEFQVVPSLPEATWDVRMHAVVTEIRLLDADEQRIGQ